MSVVRRAKDWPRFRGLGMADGSVSEATFAAKLNF